MVQYSRKLFRLFLTIVVVGLLCLILASCSNNDTTTNDNLEKTTVIRVVDGDTIIVKTKTGEERVRLIGINCAESVHPDETKNTSAGKSSSEHTKSLLPKGTEVWLEKDVSETDQYGRLLRYVWVEEPSNPNDKRGVKSKMLNAILVSDGWAEAKAYEPDTKWSNLFETLENSR